MGFFDAAAGLVSGAFGLYEGNENRKMQEQFNRNQEQLSRDQMAQQALYADKSMAQQKEFAQHGLSWKIDDAASKGIHPLVALGAQGYSSSGASVGGGGGGGGSAPQNTGMSAMGQSIERAMKAALNNQDREEVDERKARALQLENASLNNEILKAKLASDNMRTSRLAAQVGPPMPIGRIPLPRPGPDRTTSEGIAVKEDDIKQKGEDHPQTKIVRPFGYPLLAAPAFNDGQQFEDRYGESEVGSTIKFGVNTLADHVYSGYKWFGEPAYRNYDRRWLYKKLRR